MQQRVGDLIDPVLIPAGYVSPRLQHGAVVTAQRRPVDDDHLHPIQTAQSARVEDQLSGVGEPAAQYGGERLPAHVRRSGHAGQQRAGRVFGATAGQQRTCRGNQRSVRGLIGVLLHRSGHRSLRGVDGGVDGSADHDVGSLTRGRGRPVVPWGLRLGPGRRDDGNHRGLRPLRRGQLRLALSPSLAMSRRLGDLKAALRQVHQWCADRLGQPVGQGRRSAECDVGADSTQP